MNLSDRGASRARPLMSAASRFTSAVLALNLLTAAPTWAGEPLTGQATPAPANDTGPALWVVRDADSTLYLFGTVHFLRPATAWETPRVTEAFDSADLLVLEVADPEDQAAVRPLIQQYGMSPDARLSSLLTGDELARLDTAARTLGADAAQLDGMRPWLAGVALSASVLVKAGYDPGSGVDMVLRSRAAAAGTRVEGLESPDMQIRMLAGFPEEGQLAFLRRTLEEFDSALTVPDRLVEAWAAGDVEAVEALAVMPMRRNSEPVYQAVLVQRNLRWADQIATMLEGSGTTFVAVGVLHLVGDDSVPAILGARGVDVSVAP